MKNLKIYLLLFTFSLIVSSCNNDDSNNDSIEITEENIAGSWTITEYTGKTTSVFDLQGVDYNTVVDVVGTEFNDINIIFTTNPNMATQSGTMTMHVTSTTTSLGETINSSEEFNVVDYGDSPDSTWEIVNGDELITEFITPQNLPLTLNNQILKIIELTNTTMKLKFTGDGSTNNGGLITNYDLIYNMTLTR